MNRKALSGVKVLDFGWAVVGGLSGKYLGDYGAEVVRVESATRPDLVRTAQYVSLSKANSLDDKPWFNHTNSSKYSLAINLKHELARSVMDRLLLWADVVLENYTPGTMSRMGYGYEYMRKINPDIIMVSGSAYGQTGPLAHEWGVDGTGAASSGRLDLTGWPDRVPVNPSNTTYGDSVLGMINPMVVIAALDYKRRTGKGQYIDAAMLDVSAHQVASAFLDWQANKHLQCRDGNRIPNASPHGVFPCKGEDRWCAIAVFTEEEWNSFCRVMGNPPWSKHEKFITLKSRKKNEDQLEQYISEWTINHSAEKVMSLMQSAGVPAGVVQNVQDLFERDPQLKERRFLIPLKHPVLGVVNHPTPPYKLKKTEAQVKTSPCIGEHTEYVCTRLLGMSDEEFIRMLPCLV
ncbi:MAG: CoA transferase [Deltaproteobacteria bacterium]|nr:CoA transferase [Deltaproteobacteria bacterium]